MRTSIGASFMYHKHSISTQLYTTILVLLSLVDEFWTNIHTKSQCITTHKQSISTQHNYTSIRLTFPPNLPSAPSVHKQRKNDCMNTQAKHHLEPAARARGRIGAGGASAREDLEPAVRGRTYRPGAGGARE